MFYEYCIVFMYHTVNFLQILQTVIEDFAWISGLCISQLKSDFSPLKLDPEEMASIKNKFSYK